MSKNKKIKIITSAIFFIIIVGACTLLVFEILAPIQEAINTKNIEPIQEKFEGYGFWAPFFIGLAHAFLIIATIIPAQPIQIIAGLTLGHQLGFIACISGIIVGNFAIYILITKLGSNFLAIFKEKDIQKIDQLQPTPTSKRKLVAIMLMYIFPIVPYGIIAIMVANTKIRFYKYMLLTTIGTLPSLIACLWLGNLIINKSWQLVIAILLILVITTLLLSRYSKRVFAYIENHPKYDMAHFQNKARKPRPLLYGIIVFFLKIYFNRKLNIRVYNHKQFRKFKTPFILIFNHPSKMDWMYAFVPIYPNKVNAVMAYYYFCNYTLGRVLHNVGAFPKMLFQPDISSMRNIKKVIKTNGILGLSPEGRLTADGVLEEITPATGKLLKNLSAPIVLAKIDGAYMTFPKWATNLRRGRVDINFHQILSTDELQNLSVEEIDKILYNKLYYNDFIWQEKNQVYFKGDKFAEGLEHILYICPVCKDEYSYSAKGNLIKCENCHTEVILNNYYQFETNNELIPKNIHEWYSYQKEVEMNNIEDPNYQLQSKVTVKLPDPYGKGFVVVGEGVATLSHKGVSYLGTINKIYQEIEFKVQNVPAIPFGVKEDFEIYHHNTLYYFIPENIRCCVKWSVVGELIHKKYIKDNNLKQ